MSPTGPRSRAFVPVSVLALLLAASLLMLIPADAAAAPAQTTQGHITAPNRFAADPTYSTWPGLQRNSNNATGQNGIVGSTFDLVEGLHGGGTFDLQVLGGATGEEDLDIAFYSDLQGGVATATIQHRGAGGESGIIPSGSKHAIVTMFEGADVDFRFTGTPGGQPKVPVTIPASPGIYPNYGTTGFDTMAADLQSRSHVVIALVDTGINPYHVAYRRGVYSVHPSRYISGFPKDAPALGLSLNSNDYVEARTADDGPVWSKVGTERLYWIPGTNIIGAYSTGDVSGAATPSGLESRPIIDDDGHGTGVSSVSAGRGYSPVTERVFGSNHEALIVVVEGFGDRGVEWAASQPWIDFISGSYGDPTATPYNDTVPDEANPVVQTLSGREYRHTGPFVLRDGRTACFSAGNGASRTGLATDRYSSLRPTSGPSWVVTVGAVSPRNGQDYGWHSVPVDISSYGNHWPAADASSTEGEIVFSGTSSATPVTCGVFSKALLQARRALGDRNEGIHVTSDGTRVPAYSPTVRAGGLLGDGILTRQELQDAVFKTALPAPFDAETWTYDPVVIPDSPLYYTQEGYGVANVGSGSRAVDVILGRKAMPVREAVDAWIASVDQVRNAIYPPERHDG